MNISTILSKRSVFQKAKCPAILGRKLYSREPEEKITIPKRIPRGPTDILRALESTITRDPTAAHYKYHDDPYLIPMSNMQKRAFAMAQESGKKAAHWIRQENAHLFNHRDMDPIIEAFLPKVVYNEKSVVSEDDLKKSIEAVQVSDAQTVYKLLKNKGVQISKENLQALLEFVCYFNSEDTLSEEFIEERWFRQGSKGKERQRKLWKDGSFAEEIFISIENPMSDTYAAIIQGMSKYFQVERAFQLYEEALKKNLVLPVQTYNSLLSVVSFQKESAEMRWSLIIELLSDMNKTKIKPNLGTLNSILYSMSTGKVMKQEILKLLREFKDLGIEPSLGSWYYVLISFCKDRGPLSTILHDIMKEVEHKEHSIRDLSDTSFFVTAMDICRNHLNDIELAKRVDKLLHFKNNYNLIGDSFKESIYYRHYFILLVNNTPLDDFMSQVYNILVPNIYVPEPSVMVEVLNQIDIAGAIEYVSKLWSDMIIFDMVYRENLVNQILNLMVNNKPEEGSELNERFSYIAWDMFSRINTQSDKRIVRVNFTGDLLGKIMLLLLRNNDFENASTIMNKLDKEHQNILGVPKIEALSLFVDKCIENKLPSRAIACIQYCSDSGFAEVPELAARLNEKLTLDETHLASLSKIVGSVELVGKFNVDNV